MYKFSTMLILMNNFFSGMEDLFNFNKLSNDVIVTTNNSQGQKYPFKGSANNCNKFIYNVKKI